jgi:hypothetical protein
VKAGADAGEVAGGPFRQVQSQQTEILCYTF